MPKGKYIPTFVGSLHRGEPVSVRDRPASTDDPDRTCALVEVTMAEGLRSSDAAHLALDLTVESLKLCDVKVVLAPCERRVAARKAFDAFMREPGSAYVVDIVATETGLFWRVGRLAGDEVFSRERLCGANGGAASLEAIQEITDRIAGTMVSARDAGVAGAFPRHGSEPARLG